MHNFLQKLHPFTYRYYGLILILALIASLIGGYFTSKLTLESDLAELLPDSFVSVQTLERIKNEVGGIGNLEILLESNNYQSLESFANDIAPKLLGSTIIKYVDYTWECRARKFVEFLNSMK